MRVEDIKIFQVDDWAYVAAKSPEEAAAFVETGYSRPDDQEERELEVVTISGNLLNFLQKHIDSGESFPALVAIDGHYA